MNCPKYESDEKVKNGFVNNVQRYKCKKCGVMDKIMLFFRRLVKVDIFNSFYFHGFVNHILNIIAFENQIKTKPSSAGEQLVGDMFDVQQKCQSKGIILVPFDIFREPYALKNSLIRQILFLIIWFSVKFHNVVKHDIQLPKETQKIRYEKF